MKRTEKTKSKQKNIKAPRRILLAAAAAVLVLLSIFLFLRYQQSRELDLTEAYVPDMSGKSGGEEDPFGRAGSFAENLCVSPDYKALEGVSLNSASEKGLLFNLETGEALFSQDIYSRTYPASITKIMTAILALEKGDMSDVVTITREDLNLEEGSQMSGLAEGDQVTMDQLFHALVVYSANDAAMAIARQIGGTVENFVSMMNAKAAELGMTGTHFANPHGLHQEDHYTTVYDVYLMLNYAWKNQQFMDTVHLGSYSLNVTAPDGSISRSLYLTSTDQYLTGLRRPPENVTVLGGKTGTTPEAGSNLAIVVQNAYGVPYMAVIMNASNSTALYEDMDLLLTQTNSE